MVRLRATAAVSASVLVLLAACEQPITPAPAPTPSPAMHAASAAVAVGAPVADMQRASAVLAGKVSGWERPQAQGSAPKLAQAGPVIGAAAFAAIATSETLPDVAKALDRLLRSATFGNPAQR